jgi:hypothetical protein
LHHKLIHRRLIAITLSSVQFLSIVKQQLTGSSSREGGSINLFLSRVSINFYIHVSLLSALSVSLLDARSKPISIRLTAFTTFATFSLPHILFYLRSIRNTYEDLL